MVFSSLVFLFFFLPAVLICYFIAPKKLRIPVLLVFSLIFYGWGEPLYLVAMLFSIGMNFLFGALVAKWRESNRKRARLVVILSIVFNLGLLGFFKYTDFFLTNLALIPAFSSWAKPLGIALPIGISFYTFQSMSYAIDVYRFDADRQRSIVKFATYVSFFPQLIAGPIVRYKTIAEQLDFRIESKEKFRSGIVRFVIGLSKKVLLANAFGQVWEEYSALSPAARSVGGAWIGIIAYALQIYFDFGGYSDMAIGLGRMFGFEFEENFRHPYLSGSITEFWGKRWHISLGTWFREYVYFPLGGSRCSVPRNMLNLAIVWLLTGFWHGASWIFLLWGGYYAVILILEKRLYLERLKKAPRFVGIVYSLLVVLIGWTIFASTDLSSLGTYLGTMFGIGGAGVIDRTALYTLRGWLPMFIIGIFACTPCAAGIMNRVKVKLSTRGYSVLEAVLCLVGLVLSTAYIVDASYNPFLYFRF